LIWFNEKYCEAKKTGRVPVKLTEKERKDLKVNPVRWFHFASRMICRSLFVTPSTQPRSTSPSPRSH